MRFGRMQTTNHSCAKSRGNVPKHSHLFLERFQKARVCGSGISLLLVYALYLCLGFFGLDTGSTHGHVKSLILILAREPPHAESEALLLATAEKHYSSATRLASSSMETMPEMRKHGPWLPSLRITWRKTKAARRGLC